jgi:hypothetical protein
MGAFSSMNSRRREGSLPEQQDAALRASTQEANFISEEERTRLENEVLAERMRLAKNGQTDDIVSGT